MVLLPCEFAFLALAQGPPNITTCGAIVRMVAFLDRSLGRL